MRIKAAFPVWLAVRFLSCVAFSSSQAFADCICTCVNGKNVPLCASSTKVASCAKLLLTSILLIVIGAVQSAAWAKEPITGAFGIRFGDSILKYETTSNLFGTLWGVIPPEPNEYFPVVAPDTYLATTTPDGIVTGVIANKREAPQRCRAYREQIIGYLASKYGEAKRFAHDPGYGDRFVIIQDQRLVEVICADDSGRLIIEYYAKPNFNLYGLESLDYDIQELFSGKGGVDTSGF